MGASGCSRSAAKYARFAPRSRQRSGRLRDLRCRDERGFTVRAAPRSQQSRTTRLSATTVRADSLTVE